MAVSPDGKTLFVANVDNNDVMVVDISNAYSRWMKTAKVTNLFPWWEGIYPGWLVSQRSWPVSPDNNTLLVANGKGSASRPNSPPLLDKKPRSRTYRILITFPGTLQGYVSFTAAPDNAQMATYGRAGTPQFVQEFGNNFIRLQSIATR